jgi:hypothetical protein
MNKIYEQENPMMNFFTNIGEYFVDQALEKTQLIITGQNQGGNLSQKQLDQGMRPVDPSIVQTNPFASQMLNSIGLGVGGNGQSNMIMIGGAILLVGGLIFILRK